jgi:hypothetical protein
MNKNKVAAIIVQVVMEEDRQGGTLVCEECGFRCPVLPTMVIDAQRRGSWPEHCGERMGVEGTPPSNAGKHGGKMIR